MKVKGVLMYMSSYSILWALLFINNMKSFSINEVNRVFNLNPSFWYGTIVISIISLTLFFDWLSSIQDVYNPVDNPPQLDRIKVIDKATLYFSTYLIPLISINIEYWPSITVATIYILIVGIYSVKNNTLHNNILLPILGYSVYTDRYEGIILSKIDLIERFNNNLRSSGHEYNHFPEAKHYYYKVFKDN